MRPITIASLVAATAALAAAQSSTEEVGIINNTANDIIDSTNALDKDITGFTATTASECALQGAAEDLLSVLNKATNTVKPLPSFPADQVDLGLVTAFTGLQTTVLKTINDLVGKKSALDDAKVGSVVLHYISEILVAAEAYAGDIVPKIEPLAQTIAGGFSRTILNAISSGSSAFADQSGGPTTLTNCGGGGGGGGGGQTTTSPATSTAPASSATGTKPPASSASSSSPGGSSAPVYSTGTGSAPANTPSPSASGSLAPYNPNSAVSVGAGSNAGKILAGLFAAVGLVAAAL